MSKNRRCAGVRAERTHLPAFTSFVGVDPMNETVPPASVFEEVSGFPEVDPRFARQQDWHVVLRGTWRHSGEHITLREARTVGLVFRRIARNTGEHRKRHAILSDSMACCFGIAKGRSRKYGMLCAMQKIGATALATRLKLCLWWLPSERNPAVGPSRVSYLPSVAGEE